MNLNRKLVIHFLLTIQLFLPDNAKSEGLTDADSTFMVDDNPSPDTRPIETKVTITDADFDIQQVTTESFGDDGTTLINSRETFTEVMTSTPDPDGGVHETTVNDFEAFTNETETVRDKDEAFVDITKSTTIPPHASNAHTAITDKQKSSNTNCSIVNNERSTGWANFATPGFPTHYENNMDCAMTFIRHRKTSTIVAIISLSIEYSENCTNDYVNVYIGNISSTPKKFGNSLCGRLFRYYVSNLNSDYIKIVFKSDGNGVNGAGLQIKVQNYDCSIVYYQRSYGWVYFRTPGYPYYYPKNMNCTMTFMRPYKRISYISISGFIEKSENCTNDNVNIYTGNISSTPIRHDNTLVCGKIRTSKWNRDSKYTKMVFISNDNDVNGNGIRVALYEHNIFPTIYSDESMIFVLFSIPKISAQQFNHLIKPVIRRAFANLINKNCQERYVQCCSLRYPYVVDNFRRNSSDKPLAYVTEDGVDFGPNTPTIYNESIIISVSVRPDPDNPLCEYASIKKSSALIAGESMHKNTLRDSLGDEISENQK